MSDVPSPETPGDPPTAAVAGPAFSADDLVAATGGVLLRRSDRPIRGAAVDSRAVQPGQAFVALPGERTDGHRFLADAVAGGATALIVSRPPAATALEDFGDVSVVRVADGIRALGALASAWRARFDPLVVGVTGSIAKTSTKEAIAAVLGRRMRTLRSEGNQNNEIGLPLTVLALRPEHQAAVLEMGMYVGGEIADLARIGRPRIGVVTAVHAVHLARIGSLDAIEAAKSELVEALPPAREGGVAILNADDERVLRMHARTAARVLTYGFADDADVRAFGVRSAGFDGMRFELRLPSAGPAAGHGTAPGRPVSIPALGRLGVHNALAGAAVGHALGIAPEDIVAALAGGWAAPHRTAPISAGGVTVVDDSYNASPGSVTAALELLGGLPGRRIAVLGEMLELGDEAEAGHRRVGEAAATGAVDLLVVVDGQQGGGAAAVAEGALGAGMAEDRVVRVRDRAAALDALRPRLRRGDVVLVKASRGIELDRLVEDLVNELRGTAETDPASARPDGPVVGAGR